MNRTHAFALSLLIVPALAAATPARAADPCLVLDNAWYTPEQNKVISIEMDGFPGYWNQVYNSTQEVEGPDKYIVRAQSFTIRIYEGGEGSHGGPLVDTSSSGPTSTGSAASAHVLWTFVKPSDSFFTQRHFLECSDSGAWLALVHG